MSRKTISVAAVVDRTNNALSVPDSSLREILSGQTPEQAYRRALAVMLEMILNDTKSYNGFNYQSTEKENDASLKPDYDDTRRFYYTP